MNEEKLLTVARYFEGDMEFQEKSAFEALLQTDSELQQLLAEYKNVHQTLKMKIAPSEADQQVASTLSLLNQEYFKGMAENKATAKVVSFKPYLKWISIAAVLLIGLLVWAPWSASLYEKYSISREMSVAERGDGAGDGLQKASALYNAGNFSAANKILEKAYAAAPEDAMLAYYYGLTLMETGKATTARTVLGKLYAGESVFKYDAAYGIALSYVKEKDHPKALEWLEKIPEASTNYGKARELIQQLQ